MKSPAAGDRLSVARAKELTHEMWKGRLKGVQRNVEVWQALLGVRRMMLDMHEDVPTWLKFANLCRKTGRVQQSEQTLVKLLGAVRVDAELRGISQFSPGNREPDVMYAWFKHLWATGTRQDAFAGVQLLAQELGNVQLAVSAGGPEPELERELLAAKVHLKLGMWRRSLTDDLSEGSITAILSNLKAATDLAPFWGKAWHHWAYFNCEAMVYYSGADAEAAQQFVAPAVTGFFRSIELGQASADPHQLGKTASSNLQDILRLLTLWFSHGAAPDVEAALQEGFGQVSIDTWLVVIPQVSLLISPRAAQQPFFSGVGC